MLLLAQLGEIIGVLMMLLLPVLWVIKQIADATRQGQPPQPGERPAPKPVQGQAAGQPPGGAQADPLRAQVEEFLRRAGRGPQQPGEAQRRPPRQDIEVLLEDDLLPDEPRKPRQLTEPQPAAAPSPTQQPDRPRQQRRSVTPRKRKTLAERAVERNEERLSKLAQQPSHLGQRIIEDDHQFDVQLKAKFDRTVGTLGGQTISPAEQVAAPADSPAGQIAAMLASPDGVRQAIILNEILRRPSDNW
jgi:hypothetical protein